MFATSRLRLFIRPHRPLPAPYRPSPAKTPAQGGMRSRDIATARAARATGSRRRQGSPCGGSYR